MGYVESNLVSGERVVYTAKLHKAIFGPAVVVGFFALCLLALAALERSSGMLTFAYFLVFIGGILALYAYIQYRTTEMAVTNRRIIGKQGLIRRNTVEMNNTMVGAVQVNQTIIDRIINRGSITFTGAGAPANPFNGISRPLDFRRRALEAVDRRQR